MLTTRNIGWTIELDRATEALEANGLAVKRWEKTGDGLILTIGADLEEDAFEVAMADFDAWAEHEAEATEVAAGAAKQEEMETVICKTIADDQVGGLARLAAEWIDEGFTPDQAAEWINAGGFVASACAELRDADITPEQASKPANKDDESCSIAYALSNGDIDIDRAVGLVNGAAAADQYRAAVWTSEDGQGEVRLTTREQADRYGDDTLLEAGFDEAHCAGLDLTTGKIKIVMWRD